MRELAFRVLGSVSTPAFQLSRLGRDSLRILGYHGVSDLEVFERQIEYVARHANTVDGSEVGSSARPKVWVTFDDGDPSVFTGALGILDRYDVKATAFVCPGVIDTDEPFWWQTVEEAARLAVVTEAGTVDAGEVSRLKTAPDDKRRSRVAEIGGALAEQVGRPFSVPQASTSQLEAWRNAGHAIGNHTWDHPVLDTTEPREQIRQIDLAHEWLLDRGFGTDWFAYPNGNWTAVAESRLMQLGYRGALLFDHRLSTSDHAFRMSRIRVNGDDSLDEFRSKVAGLHPTLMHLRNRL